MLCLHRHHIVTATVYVRITWIDEAKNAAAKCPNMESFLSVFRTYNLEFNVFECGFRTQNLMSLNVDSELRIECL